MRCRKCGFEGHFHLFYSGEVDGDGGSDFSFECVSSFSCPECEADLDEDGNIL